jgi:hypothetical protein
MEFNIQKDCTELGWGGMDLMDLDQDGARWNALENTVMNLRVPKDAGKFLRS